jgi:hypothetical protein
MKTYTKEELKQIIELHREWLLDSSKGSCAYLQDANLRGANLRGANLQGANLQGAYLQDAILQDADLRGANLQGAYLRGAKSFIRIESQYRYQSYGYYCNGNKRVRLGCFDRTVEEWDADFWNNPGEFPEGSPQGENRLFVYNCIKTWLIDNEAL